MRVSLKWLSEYVDLRLPPDDLALRLTMAGLAVDQIVRTGEWSDDVQTARVVAVEPHPNAERLRLATVELGDGDRRTVVCGAPNIAPGQKVAFASAGARIRDGHSGKETVLKPSVIRGVESAGMVLSERELGLSGEHEGIIVLPDDVTPGRPLTEVLGDIILELSVTPNRPDWLSVVGVAREVAALTGATARDPSLDYAADGPSIEGRAAVDIEDPNLCRRYIATVIEGVRIEESPQWLKDRLMAVGQRPINNVVDVTNYVMLELGQPLHAFDYDRLAGHHIIVRRAKDGEALTTLDGEKRTLSREMLVIADESGGVALAGVIGGLESEVTDRTVNVLLEAANFAGPNVRRTSTALKVRSEASTRFEKGLPAELVAIASRRATKLLVDVCGGTAARGVIDVYPGRAPRRIVEMTHERLVKVLGIDPPPSRVIEVLTALGFEVNHERARYVATVPYWREDVRIADDLVEEVARAIGYDAVPSELLIGAVPPDIVQPLRLLRERARDALAAAGMQEVITYPLTTLEALKRVVPPEHLTIDPPYRALNPISAEHEYLRPNLRATLLQTLASNLRFQHGAIALFEAARAYQRGDRNAAYAARHFGDDALPVEREHVAGVVSGRRLDRWGRPSHEAVDFFDAKAYAVALLQSLGVRAEFTPADEYALVPGRTAEIRAGDRRVGVLGQVHPDVATSFGVEQDAYLFEIVLDDLLSLAGGTPRAAAVSRFPAVEQDVALIVDVDTPAGALQVVLEASPLVREARVFDVYTGDQMPSGKKSIAIALTYQADDHTLTDDEVAKAQRKLIERLRREFGAELRA